MHRYLGNPVLSFLGRIFFQVPIHDFHCGIRGFSRDKMQSIHLTTTGMEFASEMIVKASLNHFRITEIPTTLNKDKRERPSHLNTWSDGWRHLRFLLLYSPAWLFLVPGLFFFLTGFFASAEIGISIGERDSWQVGYGSDALQALLAALFSEGEIVRLYLHTLDWNVRAQKAFLRAGFQNCGVSWRDGRTFVVMETWAQRIDRRVAVRA